MFQLVFILLVASFFYIFDRPLISMAIVFSGVVLKSIYESKKERVNE
ncbi:hypothetical protein ACQUY5_24170 [Bacillus cereus]